MCRLNLWKLMNKFAVDIFFNTVCSGNITYKAIERIFFFFLWLCVFSCVRELADDLDIEMSFIHELLVGDSFFCGIGTQFCVKKDDSRSHLSKELLWENDVETDSAYYIYSPII